MFLWVQLRLISRCSPLIFLRIFFFSANTVYISRRGRKGCSFDEEIAIYYRCLATCFNFTVKFSEYHGIWMTFICKSFYDGITGFSSVFQWNQWDDVNTHPQHLYIHTRKYKNICNISLHFTDANEGDINKHFLNTPLYSYMN